MTGDLALTNPPRRRCQPGARRLSRAAALLIDDEGFVDPWPLDGSCAPRFVTRLVQSAGLLERCIRTEVSTAGSQAVYVLHEVVEVEPS